MKEVKRDYQGQEVTLSELLRKSINFTINTIEGFECLFGEEIDNYEAKCDGWKITYERIGKPVQVIKTTRKKSKKKATKKKVSKRKLYTK